MNAFVHVTAFSFSYFCHSMEKENLQLNKNEDANLLLMSEVRQRFEKIKQGGGKKSIEKKKNKLLLYWLLPTSNNNE